MSLAEAPPGRQPSLLDQPEQRFPLRLGVEIRKVRDLFRAATRNQWDPRTDIDWSALDGLDIDDAHRTAARMYWSRRAWSEYGAISESPALLIRFCQERREPDLRFFFTIRTQEESRHAEACYLMAEHLGTIPEIIREAFERTGSLIGTVEGLRGKGKTLLEFEPGEWRDTSLAIGSSSLLDPESVDERFEPLSNRGLFRGFLRRGTRQLFEKVRDKRRKRRKRNRGRWKRKFRELWDAASRYGD